LFKGAEANCIPVHYYAFFARSTWKECIQGWSHLSASPPICPHDSTQEPLEGFGWNIVWRLCHWGLH
jgi:hypothetical protein